MMKVKEDLSGQFIDQIFIIKRFKDTEKFTDANEAIKSVTGNLIAKFLLYKFIVLLQKGMKEKIPDLKYNDLLLIEGLEE